MIKTAVIGKTANGTIQLSRLTVMSGDRIVLVDATTGQPPKKVITKMVDKDLHIFAEGATEPSVILNDYASFSQSVDISGIDSSGAYVNYGTTEAGSMELGAVSTEAPAASVPIMSTSAWWGVGILAVAGGVAVAAGGGGGGSSGSAPAPTSTTQSAVLVDDVLIGVDYYINGTKAGTTGLDGSFTFKTGDAVTFKVGNATLGSFTPSSTDKVVTISDLAGGDQTKTENLAKFLQSLDSDTNAATTTISTVAAAKITTAADVQTDPTAGGQVTITVTNPDLSALTDITAPTAAITLSDSVLNMGETALVTITFTEAVAGFSNADVTVQNGILSNFTTSDQGVTWTATFTPTEKTTDASNNISLASTYIDQAGNAGTSVTSSNYTVDTNTTLPPPLTLAITDNDSNSTANMDGSNADGAPDSDGADILYTFTFSEAVKNFTIADIVVTMQKTDGTVDVTYTAANDPGGLVIKTFTKVSDSVYTLSVRPEAGYEGVMKVSTLDNDAVAVSTGNSIDVTNSSTLSSLQAVDMLAPVLNDTTFDGVNDWTYDYVNKTISFTLNSELEAVNMSNPGGFDVYINTHLIAVQAVSMLGNTVTLIMPKAIADDFTDLESVRVVYKDVTTDLTPAIQDLAGNDATSFTYLKPDVTPPTVKSIFFNDSALSIGQSSLVTIAFSEEIRDAVVSFQNGTLSALAPTADASVWTATFTASADVELSTSTFSVSTGDYHDLNGLAGTTTTDYPYFVDTRAPSVTISDDEPAAIANIAGGNITYTFTFSENVTGFSVEDIKITGGTAASALTTISNSVYTLVIAPTAGSVENITVDVAASKAYDSLGNANTVADQAVQKVDFQGPTVTITMDDTIVTIGETPKVTFKFSEAVIGFDVNDIDVSTANGTLSNLSSADGGITYTSTFTPSSGAVEDTTNTFTLNTTYTDIAGNIGVSSISSNYIIDTKAPANTGYTFDNLNDTIAITFDQVLDTTNHAQATDFYVTDGSSTIVNGITTINQIEVVGIGIINDMLNNTSTITLSMKPMVAGDWKVSYTDAVGNTLNAIQDLYGSDTTGFSYSAPVL